jgi:hypothetical protein
LETALQFEEREDATRTEGLAKFVDGFFDQRSIMTDVVENGDMGEQRAETGVQSRREMGACSGQGWID